MSQNKKTQSIQQPITASLNITGKLHEAQKYVSNQIVASDCLRGWWDFSEPITGQSRAG